MTELLSRAWLDAELERIWLGAEIELRRLQQILASVREVCALAGSSR